MLLLGAHYKLIRRLFDDGAYIDTLCGRILEHTFI